MVAVLPSHLRANPMIRKRSCITRFRRYRNIYRQRGATLPGLNRGLRRGSDLLLRRFRLVGRAS